MTFRFGVQAFNADSAGEWTDLARAAEDLGYGTFHLADHYLGDGAALGAARHPPQDLAAIPAMMMAAAVTERIMVGARVMCVDYHHPVVLAKSLATIDLLSDGRLEPGFGAGWITSEYEAMGIPMARPGIRIERLVEQVALARAFFRGDELDIEGAHVTAKDMRATPTSVQDGGPRIMVGGGSPRVLRAAGAIADIVSINFDNSGGAIDSNGLGSGSAARTAEKIGWVAEGAGERFDDVELEIGAYFVRVTDDGDGALSSMASTFGVPPEVLAEYPHALVGSVDHICETLQERRERYGIEYVTVGDLVLRDFAPVVERLAGT